MNGQLLDVASYEIRVCGKLDENFMQFGWLNRLRMTFQSEADGVGVTTLAGAFDQAALRGLLSYLWDMNLTVLSVDAGGGDDK
jgi:hypothetical protein